MKRILVVLLLLAVASLGFSVSGSVYGRLVPSSRGNGAQGNNGSTWYAGENGWGIPLDDLRVGRRGTGVSVNFDTFTLDYKLRAPLTGGYGLSTLKDAYTATADPDIGSGALQATSPGYFQISGLKLGPVDLGIGASWWTLGQSVDNFRTNAAGATNLQTKGSIGLNLIAMDLTYNIQIGDLSINARPWNKANMYLWFGSAEMKALDATNKADVGGFHMLLPVVIDYSAEALSVTLYTKFGIDSSAENSYDDIAGTTNKTTSGSYFVGSVAKIGYVLNELVSVFAGIGIELDSSETKVTTYPAGVETVATSNDNKTFMPLMGGIGLSVSPALTFNLGLGYNMVLSADNKTITKAGGVETTNYGTVQDGRFQSEWDTYEMHAYWKPLIKFAANTKFAGDFSAGLVFVVMLNEANGCGGNNGYRDQASHDNLGYKRISNWLNFVNIPAFDAYGGSAAYIGYAKDNFEITCWLGNESQLGGLFSHIDFAIKY